MDKWIDLVIYADGGQLIVNGVNPYNELDQMEIRDSLRRDTVAYNYYVDETQEKWDFYASSNLPLSVLYYGLVEKITGGNLFLYRIVFAIMDSLLALLIAIFILDYWRLDNITYKILAIIGLGVLSPIILYHGVLLPEDKGVQILLMLGALYFSKKRWLFMATLCLGWSVAFKGLGVFIAPLCLYYFIGEPNILRAKDSRIYKKAVLFTLLSIIFAIQPFIYYLPEVIKMMFQRLDQNVNALIPIHSSPWRFVQIIFPDTWQTIKIVGSILFCAINIIGLWRKRFGFEIATASILLWFVVISLLAGSLDRMNIAFISVILLVGMVQIKAGLILSAFYAFAGIIIFFTGYSSVHKIDSLDSELFDSIFSLFFFLIYMALLTYYTLRRKPPIAQEAL